MIASLFSPERNAIRRPPFRSGKHPWLDGLALPQPRPVQPKPPSRGKVRHGLFLARRHSGARAEVLGRDKETRDRPVPPALLLTVRNAHQRAHNGLAAVDAEAVG